MIDTKTFIFRKGPYVGKTYKYVFVNDPGHILWCIKKFSWFELSVEERQRVTKRLEFLTCSLSNVLSP